MNHLIKIIFTLSLASISFANTDLTKFTGQFRTSNCFSSDITSAHITKNQFGKTPGLKVILTNQLNMPMKEFFLGITPYQSTTVIAGTKYSFFTYVTQETHAITNLIFLNNNPYISYKNIRLARSATSNRLRLSTFEVNVGSSECVLYRIALSGVKQ